MRETTTLQEGVGGLELEPMILVNMNEKPMAVAPSVRKRVNAALGKLGNYADGGVPLETIFGRCRAEGLLPVQEDGCEWSGFLCGGAECGTEDARKQTCIFPLAMWDGERSAYRLTKLGLCLSWGTIYRSNGTRRWEFVAYVS